MINLLTRIRRSVSARLKIAASVVTYIACRMIPRFDKRETWVICERGTDARDNGYAFYRYMVKNHPEIRIHYLIHPDSADFQRVSDHAVAYGSAKNYRVVATADKIISTHCYTALPVKSERAWRMLGLEKRFYFLQHGITKGKIPYLFGNKTGMRLFCCAAIPEYMYIKENYLHPEQVVQCTGFARYDHLLPFTLKRQILIMPTWRRYLKDDKIFFASDYFSAWQAVLTDRRFIQYLQEADIQLIFYPHYELQSYLKYFKVSSPNVILADFEHFDVQQLLKESLLLITDHSSVFFDFAYMQKPTVYYQFDDEEYHQQHYKEGYFSFERDGFGNVVHTHEELIDCILRVAENGFQIEPVYYNRTKSFFAHHDHCNCERIYEAITRL